MRTFSLVEGTSDKFWHVDVAGAAVTVNFGRTGTKGQTKTTEYADAAKAQAEADKLIASKVKKGYVEGAEGGGITPVAPTAKAAPAPRAASTTAPVATAPAAAPEPAWENSDDLGLRVTPAELASVAGNPPLDETREEGFDAVAEAAWVRGHAIKHDWGNRHYFTGEPMSALPSQERARWWLRFAEPEPEPRWAGMYDSRTMRERLADAPKGTEVDLDLAFSAMSDTPSFALTAAFATFATPEETFTAALDVAGHWSYDRAGRVPALRALVLPHLGGRELPFPATPSRKTRDRPHRGAATEATIDALLRAALFGDADEAAARLDAYIEENGADVVNMDLVNAGLSAIPDVGVRRALGARVRPQRIEPHQLRQFLVLVGTPALETLERTLFTSSQDSWSMYKEVTVATLEALVEAVHGPAAVPTMLRLSTHNIGAAPATAWLVAHPAAIAASSAPIAPAQRDVLRGVARTVLGADPAAFGPQIDNPVLAQIVEELAAEAAMPRIGAAEAPAWWAEAAAAEEAAELPEGATKIPAKLPEWAADSLPPVVVDGARLDEELVRALVMSAVRGANDETRAPRPLVAAVRERMLGKDRDEVGRALLAGYLGAGARPADKALFLAAGYLGGDGLVDTLAPLVREWPGQSQHQRAVLGLEVLAATGTSAALQAISGIANKSKFKGVQKAAQESLAKLAALRGLTVDQLEDRVVPDGGLDEQGVRVLDFGPRAFRVSLSPQGKAVIRDLDAEGRPTGKPRTALPAPNAKDDAELAAAAKSDFAVLRKQLTEVAKIQTARLEKAIVTGRTWPADEHRTLVVEHPVLNSLIRPLVWQVSVDDAPVALVRATEDHAYVTVDEEDYAVPEGATLSLAHPLHVAEADRDAWRAHLVDYDLVAPLEQLDRATFALPAGQDGHKMAGLPAGKINPGTLVSTLERMGWRRGIPADAGVVSYLWLPFESLGLAAVLSISDGLWTGMIQESGDQTLDVLAIGPIEQVSTLWYWHDRDGGWLDWSTIDPVVVSEVLRAVDALAAKMT